MKPLFNYVFYTLLLIALNSLIHKPVGAQSTVQSHNLLVTYHKTSSVIFPALIKSVDRGSLDIIAQKAKEVGNVLHLKAARTDFPETNLTVITSDGVLHQFTINYADQPTKLSLEVTASGLSEDEGSGKVIFTTQLTETQLEACARNILRANRPFSIRKKREYKITLALKGIYIRDNVMFYHLALRNTSNIPYDVDMLRFYIRDQQQVKRTSSQEVDVKPTYVYGDATTIAANTMNEVVVAVDKFTIPDARCLIIEIFEQDGGRNLNMTIKNKFIVNAQPVP